MLLNALNVNISYITSALHCRLFVCEKCTPTPVEYTNLALDQTRDSESTHTKLLDDIYNSISEISGGILKIDFNAISAENEAKHKETEHSIKSLEEKFANQEKRVEGHFEKWNKEAQIIRKCNGVECVSSIGAEAEFMKKQAEAQRNEIELLQSELETKIKLSDGTDKVVSKLKEENKVLISKLNSASTNLAKLEDEVSTLRSENSNLKIELNKLSCLIECEASKASSRGEEAS